MQQQRSSIEALMNPTDNQESRVQDELHLLRQTFGTSKFLMNEEREYLRSMYTKESDIDIPQPAYDKTQVNCACGFCFLDYPSDMKRELLSLDNDWADGLVTTSEVYWQRRDDIALRFGFGPIDSNEVMEWEKEEWDV